MCSGWSSLISILSCGRRVLLHVHGLNVDDCTHIQLRNIVYTCYALWFLFLCFFLFLEKPLFLNPFYSHYTDGSIYSFHKSLNVCFMCTNLRLLVLIHILSCRWLKRVRMHLPRVCTKCTKHFCYIYKLHLHVQKCFVIGLYYNQYSNLFKGIKIYELFFHKGLKYTNTLYWH